MMCRTVYETSIHFNTSALLGNVNFFDVGERRFFFYHLDKSVSFKYEFLSTDKKTFAIGILRFNEFIIDKKFFEITVSPGQCIIRMYNKSATIKMTGDIVAQLKKMFLWILFENILRA